MKFKNIKGDYHFTERVNDVFCINVLNKFDNSIYVKLFITKEIIYNIYFQRCKKI